MIPFKAYDIRGHYPEEVHPIFAYDLGLAFATYMKKHKYGNKVVVGKDSRIGSPELQEKFMLGCLDGGLDVSAILYCTSPALYYMTKFFDAGVMVTASHNPKEDNGFKFSLKNAKTISYEDGLDKIEKLMTKVKPRNKSHKFDIVSLSAYFNKIKKDFEYVDFKKLKVVVDSGNGASAITYSKVFKELEINYKPLFLEMDGNFPNHDPNPTKPGALDQLIKEVKETKSDIGLAFDGDGDRLVVVDNEGNIINPSVTGKIIAQHYFTPEANFVLDIRLSKSVKEYIYENGGEVFFSKVGQVNIKKQMRNTKAILGIEASGHIMHGPLLNIDDALYSALIILKQLAYKKEKLSDIHKSLQKYNILEENILVKDKEKAILTIRKNFKNARMQFLDGITLEYSDWWANIRESNTEDLLRITLEADNEKLAKSKMKEITELLKSIS